MAENFSFAKHISVLAAQQALAASARPYNNLFQHGTLTVEIYQPVEVDLQQQHDRDECYVIINGDGLFEMGDVHIAFAPGDFLFVPAGMPHRFYDFGYSMCCWVIFFGPPGGERPNINNS